MSIHLKYVFAMAIGLICWGFFAQPELASASTVNIDVDSVKATSENVSLDGMMSLAKEYSIPILIVLVVLSGFSALIGLAFKPAKILAGSLLGMGLLFFLLVNFAPQIVGIMMAAVDSVMSRVTGS
ncbi:hypothetical protein [Robertmurraya massiliosenegalensis]|uniref:hypothetical protein n=1 Tax=Robertmurraya massiliosenegalensis TaxID=1287657 RepID=UPI0002EB5A32|nr:hypothetical protein [Robertmurraya massiliosenegalensis]